MTAILKTMIEPLSTSQLRILVVEDEQDLQDLLDFNLKREGYQTIAVGSGELALEHIKKDLPNLVLLDLMLPGIDGLNVCRTMKANAETKDIPVVMLTAKGEEADVVLGLELGAEDYITKPFSPRVLLARINAILRRRQQASENTDSDQIIRVNDLVIDLERHEVHVGEALLDLTATEFKLLCLLATKPGRVFTRHQIIQAIHGGLAAVTDRSVDVQVVALRRKLGETGDRLETVRGVGYRFRD